MSERVAIVGSRGFVDTQKVVDYVAALPVGTVVVSGGAIGVDSVAEMVAHKMGLAVMVFFPDYDTHGRRAPLVRNETIAQSCHRLVAFHDGKSTGTLHVMGCAKRLGKPVEVIR